MKHDKKISMALAVLLATGIGVGCNGKQDTTANEIRLTVWVSESDQAFASSVVKQFERENPDKKYLFSIDVQGENELATRLLNDVEAGADVFAYPNDQIAKLINGDALARVAGSRLESIKSENAPDAVKSATATVNGEEGVYGMPYTDNTFFLYYDKSVFTEQDVQSIDGILSKCNSNKKFAFPMTDGWYTTSFFFGKGLGYQVEYDNALAETQITCDFNSTTGEEVAQAMWMLVKDTRCKPDANDSKITAGFEDGSIVAAVSGIWNRKSIESSLGENFGVAKLPTYTFRKGEEGEEQVQLVSFSGYKLMGVNNYSKSKAEAFAFAQFYTNKENQIKHFEERGILPTNLQAREDERVKNDVYAQAITQQLAYSKPQINVPSTLWTPMEGLGNAMITGIQSGVFNVKQQLSACVSAIEK